MYKKYRIFYELHYRGDSLDYREDTNAIDDQDVINKAHRFIQEMNDKRKEETRATLIKNGVSDAQQFTDEQLLTGNRFVLVGISSVTETLTQVEVKQVKQENLLPISGFLE